MPPRTPEEASAAAEGGDVVALAAYCEQAGVDVNKPVDPATGETLLHVASAGGQEASVRALIQAGCKLAVLDNDDQNALHYACNEGHLAIARLLVQNGIGASELNRLDKYQMSPLHLAVEGGHLELVRFLTSLPHADEKIRRGSVTFIAQRHDHAAIVDLLSRPRETQYDEHGHRVDFRSRSESGSFSTTPSLAGGRTAAARRRSKAASEDGSMKSASTNATSSRIATAGGGISTGGATGEASRATSRSGTPRPAAATVRRADGGARFCGTCNIS
ncbi:hypothetical protein KFE25_012400 [Diacronema lutheri]|uniref:Uncharacterized protein n=1 Tax=Diacronema lutheri TaxID=2081491 RepID=A0A8J6C825_DIALT|nr:hypothetical protein KFE25_012400 [Diacronema lutheri]